jgi:Peptidase family M23
MRFPLRVIAVMSISALAAFGRTPAADSYLFPTDASRQINSGFADYRASHFHGGIDISTNGQIGYPVYAAKSGYVYSVSVSPFGYGRKVVLRHDDSTFTLYGHLSEFSDEIEKRVEAEQQSEGKYGVDIHFQPGEIRVERGEIIARTGASGVGGPHLHFEIHDKDFSFVDPLIYKSLDVTRYRTPRIFGVAVRGFNSGRASFSSVTGMKNRYHARKTFHVNEPFFFIIHAADSYGRGRYKRPPKYIDLKIDGRDFIRLDLTHFSYDDYLDVGSLVDFSLSRGYKTYYRLCVDRGIPFNVFTPAAPLSGLVGGEISNGEHDYEITVRDENGDSASVNGRFILNIAKDLASAGKAVADDPPAIEPFAGTVVNPMPGLTLRFRANSFIRNVDLEVQKISPTSFAIRSGGMELRKRISLEWTVDDPKLQLYRKGRRSWIRIPCQNDGKLLTAEIGYETGEFALIRDDTPPVVQRIRVSRKNPFYRSVAPTHFRRDFVYFRVFDRMSNINTDNILLKVGTQNFLCEYDVDKHAAVCRVDANLLRRERKVEVVVHDNAGNEKRVTSRLRF